MVKLSSQMCLHITESLLKQMPKNIKGKSNVAQKWLTRQLNDPYAKRSHQDNYRCRSVYKLEEMDDKFKLLKPGQIVIDCGASPGSWTQLAVHRTNASGVDEDKSKGKVIGIDLQQITPIPGATLLSYHDFTQPETALKIMDLLQGEKADVIISDMAPNATGIKQLDHEKIVDLCIKCLSFSMTILKQDGTFLCKIWQGALEKSLINLLKEEFKTVQLVKPHASRNDSAEAFILARKFYVA